MSLRRIRTIIWRHALALKRTPIKWFDTFWWTTVDVLIFGSIGAFLERSGASTGATYFLAAVMLVHLMYQFQIGMSTSFLEETWSRNLINIMVTPLRESELAVGFGLFSLAKTAIAMIWLIGLSWLAYSFHLSRIGALLFPAVFELLLISLGLSWLVIALVLRFGQSAEGLAWGTAFILAPLSGLYSPTSSLPTPLRQFSAVLPTTYIFRAARDAVLNQPVASRDVLWGFLGSAVVCVLGGMYALHCLRVFRQRGFVTRYS